MNELLTEEQIELAVSRKMDSLDWRLMNTDLTQEAYDIEVKRIDAWTNYQFDKIS